MLVPQRETPWVAQKVTLMVARRVAVRVAMWVARLGLQRGSCLVDR